MLLSWLLVRDTRAYTQLERPTNAAASPNPLPTFRAIFARTSWGDRTLFAACQAGLVNNLNDGKSWGIFPIFFAAQGLHIEGIGILKFVYPAVWGVCQVITGPLADTIGRKRLIAAGMGVQAAGIWLILATRTFDWWLGGSVLLGLGYAIGALLAGVIADLIGIGWAIGVVGGPALLSGIVTAVVMVEKRT